MTEEQKREQASKAATAAIERLKEIAGMSDTEAAHMDADEALLVFLRAAGYSDVADAWESAAEAHMGFWYS